jgi:hypothetical protein
MFLSEVLFILLVLEGSVLYKGWGFFGGSISILGIISRLQDQLSSSEPSTKIAKLMASCLVPGFGVGRFKLAIKLPLQAK